MPARRSLTALGGAMPTDDAGRVDADDNDLNPDAYDPRILDRSVISIPLLRRIRHALDTDQPRPIPVVIDVNLNYPGGRPAATDRTLELIETAVDEGGGAGV